MSIRLLFGQPPCDVNFGLSNETLTVIFRPFSYLEKFAGDRKMNDTDMSEVEDILKNTAWTELVIRMRQIDNPELCTRIGLFWNTTVFPLIKDRVLSKCTYSHGNKITFKDVKYINFKAKKVVIITGRMCMTVNPIFHDFPALNHTCVEHVKFVGSIVGFVDRLGDIAGKTPVLTLDGHPPIIGRRSGASLETQTTTHAEKYTSLIRGLIMAPPGSLKNLNVSLPLIATDKDILPYLETCNNNGPLTNKLDTFGFHYYLDDIEHSVCFPPHVMSLLNFLRSVSPLVGQVKLRGQSWPDVVSSLALLPTMPEVNEDVDYDEFGNIALYDNTILLRNDVLYWGQVLQEIKSSSRYRKREVPHLTTLGVQRNRFREITKDDVSNEDLVVSVVMNDIFASMLRKIGTELLTYEFIQYNMNTVLEPQTVSTESLDLLQFLHAMNLEHKTDVFGTVANTRIAGMITPEYNWTFNQCFVVARSPGEANDRRSEVYNLLGRYDDDDRKDSLVKDNLQEAANYFLHNMPKFGNEVNYFSGKDY